MTRALPLVLLLFVAGRFAPAIHALIPHHEESDLHCDHELPVHVDAAEEHSDHADCPLCSGATTGLLNAAAPALFTPLLPDSARPDAGALVPAGLAIALADSRAPPVRPS